MRSLLAITLSSVLSAVLLNASVSNLFASSKDFEDAIFKFGSNLWTSKAVAAPVTGNISIAILSHTRTFKCEIYDSSAIYNLASPSLKKRRMSFLDRPSSFVLMSSSSLHDYSREYLTYKDHLQYICSRVSKRIGALQRTDHILLQPTPH